jgi:hypothetical protein
VLRPTLHSSLDRPKLRPVRQVISSLTWRFAGLARWRSAYIKVSVIGVPSRLKAPRCALVGSVSIGTVTWVPANRTWLRSGWPGGPAGHGSCPAPPR